MNFFYFSNQIQIKDPSKPLYLGYIALLICVLFFASVSLPIKKYELKDGISYQLFYSLAIWILGFVVNCIRGFPKFYYLSMLGGITWSTANILSVTVIKCIGIGVGTLLWGTTGILVGWSNARFGIFGTTKEHVNNELMNYFGVIFIALSAVFYVFIKVDNLSETESAERQPLIDINEPVVIEANFVDRLNPNIRKIFGITLAGLTGILYALTYIPYLYCIDNYDKSSQNGLDYIFSLFTGILITSFVYFIVYSCVQRNRPFVNHESILPAIISGFIWACANIAFLYANTVLSQAITFPIAGSTPSYLASLYGIFLFKEISGLKNFLVLISGFIINTLGAILCGLSK